MAQADGWSCRISGQTGYMSTTCSPTQASHALLLPIPLLLIMFNMTLQKHITLFNLDHVTSFQRPPPPNHPPLAPSLPLAAPPPKPGVLRPAPVPWFETAAASGPRSFCFHPNGRWSARRRRQPPPRPSLLVFAAFLFKFRPPIQPGGIFPPSPHTNTEISHHRPSAFPPLPQPLLLLSLPATGFLHHLREHRHSSPRSLCQGRRWKTRGGKNKKTEEREDMRQRREEH